jgi:methyl-accepting chemotaxis protein
MGRRTVRDLGVSAKVLTAVAVAALVALAVGDIKAAMLQARLTLGNHAISRDVATMAKYEEQFGRDLKAVEDAFVAYRGSAPAEHLRTLDVEEDHDAAGEAEAAHRDYRDSRLISLVLLIAGLSAALLLGWFVARGIVRSLDRVRRVCAALAAGDLTRTAGLTSRDEPGQMARSLDEAMVRLRETVSTIDGSASSPAGAAEQMSAVSGQIAASAQQTSAQAQAVSAAAEEISRSVDTVSAGSEEMGASIREISQNATEAAQVAGEAVGLASATSGTMGKLGESSAEIGNVITAIAVQTNLLALKPPSRRPAPARRARASRSSRARSRTWRRRPPGPPRTSPGASRRSRPTRPARSRRSRRSAG